MDIVIGLAPRSRRESSGLCVAEVERRYAKDGTREEHFVIRHLEPLPPGTTFPEMAERCGEVAKGVTARTDSRPEVFIDATGLGDEIVSLVERYGDYRSTYSIYFTYGDRRNEESREVRLGKAWLVTRLQLLLQTDRLHLPDTPDARQLAEDLLDFEVKIHPHANETEGAFPVGSRDHLVTALGLTVQRPATPTFSAGRIRWG